MKILVIDRFNERRDLAQMDMYRAMSERHDVILSKDPPGDVKKGEYDLLYLGIYHTRMDVKPLLEVNSKPVIADQADNEEFCQEPDIYNGVTVLSRYLPNPELEAHCKKIGADLKLLPWYVDPERVPKYKKVYDAAFICSIYGERRKMAQRIRKVCTLNRRRCVVGEYFGEKYLVMLAKSKVLFIECSRRCLTQKYIEGALAGCFLAGDSPIYPPNDLAVLPMNLKDRKKILKALDVKSGGLVTNHNLEYMKETFANKTWWLNQFEKIL